MKRLKNIKPGTLIGHIVVTLLYPAFKAVSVDGKRLLVFTDALTIIAMVLLVVGVVYSLVLRGDLDISGFLLKRGIQRKGEPQTFKTYMENRKEKREVAFNYPLFLGVIYFALSALIAYTLL